MDRKWNLRLQSRVIRENSDNLISCELQVQASEKDRYIPREKSFTIKQVELSEDDFSISFNLDHDVVTKLACFGAGVSKMTIGELKTNVLQIVNLEPAEDALFTLKLPAAEAID